MKNDEYSLTVARSTVAMILSWVVDKSISPEQGLRLISKECRFDDVDSLVKMFGVPASLQQLSDRTALEWTDTENETVIAMWNDGAKCEQISERIGRSQQAVYQRLHGQRKSGRKIAIRRQSAIGNKYTTGRKKK